MSTLYVLKTREPVRSIKKKPCRLPFLAMRFVGSAEKSIYFYSTIMCFTFSAFPKLLTETDLSIISTNSFPALLFYTCLLVIVVYFVTRKVYRTILWIIEKDYRNSKNSSLSPEDSLRSAYHNTHYNVTHTSK